MPICIIKRSIKVKNRYLQNLSNSKKIRMYFGGTTNNFQPNEYAMDRQVARYDHLWPGREDGTASGLRKKQQQYAEELKRQMAEKNAQKQREKSEFSSTLPQRSSQNNYPTNYQTNFQPSNSNYNPSNLNKNISTIGQRDYTDAYARAARNPDFSRTLPSSDFSQTAQPLSTLSRTTNFTETLRAQIDDTRQSNYSALAVPIQPLSSTQPIQTFVGSATFDPGQIDMPNLSLFMRSRPIGGGGGGDHQHVRSISMNGASSMRSSLDYSRIQPPQISHESPLSRSKVATPSTGFSIRHINSTRANYANTSSNSYTGNNYSSNLASTFSNTGNYGGYSNPGMASTMKKSLNQTYNPANFTNTQASFPQSLNSTDGSLMSDSRMLYPDGHMSPL
ncbi:hypothetical protein TRFO_16209 [Tritrichomonas foetus]|uniref:Uncharacterized protein n=1 Tax=Tritrichomonas foetus TaxID=1144522 RepID=A0A1J4KQV6_9EUKA|nr:hypothetical protein TRFO_16209 [Tritrichomonas foetus]|eukprot:OHT13647.1 hypothetical protein TRFO_16209 [Tritrichomonas foetus]